MKNNKGFSLVELIIVIAIMAILVGVMAPQLIKYIEKANVSADTQICDSVRTAVQTTIMDPAIVTDKTYTDITSIAGTTGKTWTSVDSVCHDATCSAFTTNMEDLLSVAAGTGIDDTLGAQLKSSGAKTQATGTGFSVYVGPKGANIIVFLPNTDASGAKQTGLTTPNSVTASSCIFAGTLVGGENFN